MRRHSLGLLPGLLALATAAIAAAAPALAADMPTPAPAPSYTPQVYRPALYDWTGIYLGVHVGTGLMEDAVSTTTTTTLQNSGTVTNLSPYAIIGGGQVGANVEFSSIVLGVEGRWTASGISGSQVTTSLLTPSPNGIGERSTSTAFWYATATGRIGYAANDLLIYAKGGAAWMRANYSQALVSGGLQSTQTISDTRHGFTVGGGLEYAFNEYLSAQLEYDFLDFGSRGYNFGNLSYMPTPGVTVPIGAFPVSVKSSTSMLTAGFNYRFNWGGGGPLVAKY
jgi:outer membrane immunogenic protein